jgi:hypothetical protein
MSKGNIYVIDTCSLVELERYHPIDIFPSVWASLESLIKKKLLFAPREVLKEIRSENSQLYKCTKKQKDFFKNVTEKQIEIVKDILKKYPSIVKVDRPNCADPFVIALAIEMNNDCQKTLYPVKRIVVTEEKLRGNEIKIPFICQAYSIGCIDLIDMFREEKLKF